MLLRVPSAAAASVLHAQRSLRRLLSWSSVCDCVRAPSRPAAAITCVSTFIDDEASVQVVATATDP